LIKYNCQKEREKNPLKNFSKKFKKTLDTDKQKCYTKDVKERERKKTLQKKNKKNLKNLLTN